MPFVALNAQEDELKKKDEKLSLEFQFEDALRLFERALAMQKDKDPGTMAVFEELLRFPLFDLDANKNVPPSTPRLKCLALKNYCILMLDELRQVTEADRAKEQLLHIIDQLLEALALYNDPAIISLLLSLAQPLNNIKVARVALEELVSNTMHRPLSAIEAGNSSNAVNLVGPRDEDALARLRELTMSIGDLTSIPLCYKTFPSFQTDLDWIREYQFDNTLKPVMEGLAKESVVVKIPKRELSVIAASVEGSLDSISKKRKNQPGDAYKFCDQPISRVLFKAPHEHTEPEEPKMEIDSTITDQNERTDAAELVGTAAAVVPAESEAAPAQDIQPVAATASDKSQPPVPLRSSARNRSELGLPADFSASEVLFSQNMSSYLALVGMSYANVLPDFEGKTGYLSDFNNLLENWDDDQANQFTNKATSEVDLSLPVMQMLDFAAIKQKPSNVAEIDRPDLVQALLEADSSHIQLVRFRIFELLFCSHGAEPPLVLTAHLDSKLQATLESLVGSFAPQVAEYARSQPSAQIAEMSQALFEFYVDKFTLKQREIRKRQANISNPKKRGAPNEATRQEALLREACAMWRGVTSDLLSHSSQQLVLRYSWVSIFHNQALGDEPAEIMEKFEQFKQLLAQNTLTLRFSNWPSIPTASLEDADTQIAKFRAVSIFSRVFLKEDDSVPLLEAMLMPESYCGEPVPESEAIAQFLKTCTLEFKLSLWYLLLDQYEQDGERDKSMKGLLQILDFGIKAVTAESLKEKAVEERSYIILQCVNLAHDVCKRLLPLARGCSVFDLYARVSRSEALRALENLTKLCELLQIFSIYDHAINSNVLKSPTHHSWETAVKKLRELSVLAWCLFYLFFVTCLPEDTRAPDVLNDTLSLIHDHLGNRGYCSLANGALLELNISVILLLKWSHSEADLLQCIRCRYGISLSSESFTPFAHYALTVDLTRKDALRLSGFIMDMILGKKNLAQAIQRQNVRLVLSTFNDAIGPPDASTPLVVRNMSSIESFVEHTDVDLKTMRQIIRSSPLSLVTSSDPIFATLGGGGLYYVMALVSLNQYRIKKRTTPEKTDDLLEAVKFLIFDLSYGSNRFESWMSLCQAFDYLAETSLTFTTPDDQKVSGEAVKYQRKAILCGCVAVNALAQARKRPLSREFFTSLAESLPHTMGKLLFFAASPPLSMAPFTITPKYVFVEDGYSLKHPEPAKREAILKLALYYLNKSDDWTSILLKSELLDELAAEPSEVLDLALSSLDLCATMAPSKDLKGNQDLIFEPQQQVFLLCWKYFKAKRLPNQKLVETLLHTKLASSKDSSDAGFTKSLIEGLEALCAADKKHWMHQPRFLLAQVHEHLGDTKTAQKEMDEIISTKSVTRPLVGIWKPKLERSGEHFNFCRDYVTYYADLALKNKDDLSMAQLARKARKFTSMTDYLQVWSHILGCATTLVRDLIKVPAKFAEKQLNALELGQFEAKSMALEKFVGDKCRDNTVKDFSPWLQGLDYAHDLKKMNIGLGTTASVDDLVITLYLCLYDLWEPGRTFDETPREVQKGPAPPDASKKVKVSKKDILTKAALLLRLSSAKLWLKTDSKCIPSELYDQGNQFEDDKVAERKNKVVTALPPVVQPLPQPAPEVAKPAPAKKISMMAPMADTTAESDDYYMEDV